MCKDAEGAQVSRFARGRWPKKMIISWLWYSSYGGKHLYFLRNNFRGHAGFSWTSVTLNWHYSHPALPWTVASLNIVTLNLGYSGIIFRDHVKLSTTRGAIKEWDRGFRMKSMLIRVGMFFVVSDATVFRPAGHWNITRRESDCELKIEYYRVHAPHQSTYVLICKL